MDESQNEPTPPDAPREPKPYEDGSADEQASPIPPLDPEDGAIPPDTDTDTGDATR